MSVQVKVPAVGESISEVTIAKWLKNEGVHVEQDEIICELESDKATFELPAETAGTLKIIAKEGDTIAVGDVICEISGNGEAKAAPAKAEQPAAAKNEAASAQTSAPAAHN
ncbi:MAG: dihydrolipoamide succinyltransferase, partial [Sphingobacteriales bacterium]